MQKSEETDDIHREIGATAIRKSEDSVQRAMTAMESFTNPFSVEASRLVSLSSGATVPPEVEKDVLDAEKIGKEQKDSFIKECLVEKKKDFFDPIHQLKLKTMAQTSKSVKLRSKQNKVTELKQQGNIAFQLLLKSQQ